MRPAPLRPGLAVMPAFEPTAELPWQGIRRPCRPYPCVLPVPAAKPDMVRSRPCGDRCPGIDRGRGKRNSPGKPANRAPGPHRQYETARIRGRMSPHRAQDGVAFDKPGIAGAVHRPCARATTGAATRTNRHTRRPGMKKPQVRWVRRQRLEPAD